MHQRPWYALWVIRSGQVRLERGTTRQRFNAPVAVLVPPDSEHTLVIPRGAEAHELEFDVVRVGRTPRTWPHAPDAPGLDQLVVQPDPLAVWGITFPVPLPADWFERTLAVVSDAGDRWWRDVLGQAQANARLSVWLADLAERLKATTATEAPGDDPWLARAWTVARLHLERGLTVDDWARRLGCTRQHLHRRMQAATGWPPAEWLITMRSRRARDLLRDPTWSIAEIARACGFKAATTFTHFFTRHHGLSPRDWRRLSSPLPMS